MLYRNTAPAVVNLGEDATVHHGIDRASCEKTLTTVSFNLHGFYQGCPVLEDLIASEQPDILMLQEHWLTPAELCLFNSRFTNYIYGATRMHSADYAMAGGLSVRPSHAGIVSKRLHISSKFFSPSGSPIILVFPYHTEWQYSDGDPLTGALR